MSSVVREKPRVALVGGETPLGAELRDVLNGSILGGRVKLIGSEDTGEAVLSAEDGEPVVITALDGDELNAAKVVFFAGQLLFEQDTWYHRLLHNQTAFSLQRRLQWVGLPMVILPTRVR